MDYKTVRSESIEKCYEIIERVYKLSRGEYEILSIEEKKKYSFLKLASYPEYEIKFIENGRGRRNLQGNVQPYGKSRYSGQVLSDSAYDKNKFEEERNKILRASPAKVDPAMVKIMSKLENIDSYIKNQKDVPQKNFEHENLSKLEKLLVKNDFTYGFINEIMEKTRQELSIEQIDDFEILKECVIKWIGERIPIYKEGNNSRPRIMILIGPTGVGKTTTIAKFAAVFLNFAERKPVKLKIITIDKYKIGAKNQMDKYGEIMCVDVIFASTRDDLQNAIKNSLDDTDIILIDTIGSGPKEYKRIIEMRSILDCCGAYNDIHLTMSATTKASDIQECIKQYETFGYHSIIFTKMDETRHVGNIISLLWESGKPLSYLTTGQTVPNDIERASVAGILSRLEGFGFTEEKLLEFFPENEKVKFNWR